MEAAAQLTSLGKYHLIASLGQGGMANVYLAMVGGLAGFNKLLVVKVLRQDVMAGLDEGVDMFLDEARLCARLVHPNIVHTYEVGETQGRYFLAMEYLEGQTYRNLHIRAGASGVPIQEELRIILETARGLHYSHELKGYSGEDLGVVHRDVSPQNVFITYDGQIKLLDFGIAKMSNAEHMTKVGVIKGKLDYIAPEQLRGDAIDRRADVFALGVMLWEAITGKRFGGGRRVPEIQKAQARLSGGEPNVRVAQPEVPEELATIVDRALALNPDARFPTAAAFADALEAYIESTGHKPSAKSLSAVITPLFDEDRRKIAKLIESQIQKMKQTNTSGTVRIGDTTDGLLRVNLNAENSSGALLNLGQQEEGSVSKARSLAPLTASQRPSALKRIGRTVAIGAALIGAMAFGAYGFGEEPAGTTVTPVPTLTAQAPMTNALPSPPPPEPVQAAAAPASPIPSAATVQVLIKVEPSKARVTLDGAPLTVPFTGEFRKDSTLHHLDVTADGYRPLKQLVAFDRDLVLELSLERERAPQPSGRRVSSPPPSPPAEKPSEPAAAPPPAPRNVPSIELTSKRRITPGDLDSDNPYRSK